MAKQNETDEAKLARALERAAKDGVKIVADFGAHWRVRGSDGVTLYEVRLVTVLGENGEADQEVTCSCRTKAGVLCKHRALVIALLAQREAEREAAVAATLAEMAAQDAPIFASVEAWEQYYADLAAWNARAVAETEASERVLAEAEMVAAAASVPDAVVVLLAAGMARARVQAEQEARWSRYQDMRASGW